MIIVHGFNCVSTPEQFFPPRRGAGCSHSLFRQRSPFSHETEQFPHSAHFSRQPRRPAETPMSLLVSPSSSPHQCRDGGSSLGRMVDRQSAVFLRPSWRWDSLAMTKTSRSTSSTVHAPHRSASPE